MNEYMPDPNLNTEQRRNHILAWVFQRTQDQERRIAALEVTAMKIGVWRDDGRAWQCRCRYTGRRTSTWNDASRYCCPDCGVFRPRDAQHGTWHQSESPRKSYWSCACVGEAAAPVRNAANVGSCSHCRLLRPESVGVWRTTNSWTCACGDNHDFVIQCGNCGGLRPAPQAGPTDTAHDKDAGHSPSCSDCAPSGYACDRHFMPSDPGALQRLDRIYPERLARFNPVATLDGSDGSARSTAEIGTWFGDGTWKCGCDQYPPRPADWDDCGACKFTRPAAPSAPSTSLDQANQELTSLRAQLSEAMGGTLCVACGVNKRLNQIDRWCRWCRKDDDAKLARLDAAVAERDALKKRMADLEREEPMVVPPGYSPAENIEDYARDLRIRLEDTDRPDVRTRMIIRALAVWAKEVNAAVVLELERVRVEAASQARTDQERIAATETEMRRLVSVVHTQRERVEQALGLDD